MRAELQVAPPEVPAVRRSKLQHTLTASLGAKPMGSAAACETPASNVGNSPHVPFRTANAVLNLRRVI